MAIDIFLSFLRVDRVLDVTGHLSHATIYNHIKAGLFTKPVPIGKRSVGWPSYEVDALNRARIAGLSDDEIRALVNRLHEKRTALMNA